jgi:GT2 family glycosyltransferase
MSVKLSIVIPVYNQYSYTANAIKDLLQLRVDKEIIIVDNGSVDSTKDIVGKDIIKVVRNSKNLGFAKAVNQGYNISEGEFVLFLNNDIRVRERHETWVEGMLDVASTGLVGPTMGGLDEQFNFMGEFGKHPTTRHYYMSGWNILGSRYTWEKFVLTNGPWDDETFWSYFEDTDLGFRAREQGEKMTIVPVPVHHFGSVTSKKMNLNELYKKARIAFINKWSQKASQLP